MSRWERAPSATCPRCRRCPSRARRRNRPLRRTPRRCRRPPHRPRPSPAPRRSPAPTAAPAAPTCSAPDLAVLNAWPQSTPPETSARNEASMVRNGRVWEVVDIRWLLGVRVGWRRPLVQSACRRRTAAGSMACAAIARRGRVLQSATCNPQPSAPDDVAATAVASWSSSTRAGCRRRSYPVTGANISSSNGSIRRAAASSASRAACSTARGCGS